MSNVVYAKANPNAAIREGDAVSYIPMALVTPISGVNPSVLASDRGASSDAGSEVGIADNLATRFTNINYYYENRPNIIGSGDASIPASGNMPAVITYPAQVNRSHVIYNASWSYDTAPTGGFLQIEDGANNIVFKEYISNAGPGFFNFGRGKQGSVNTDMIITLGAAGGSVKGTLDVDHGVV